MTWTSTPPDRPGWWFRRVRYSHTGTYSEPDVVYVLPPRCQMFRLSLTLYTVRPNNSSYSFEWAGPIPEPTDPPTDALGVTVDELRRKGANP